VINLTNVTAQLHTWWNTTGYMLMGNVNALLIAQPSSHFILSTV